MILNDKIEYEIEFYEDSDGHSDIDDFLNDLATKGIKNKDARIQFRQVALYIELLAKNGSTLSEDIMKHIEDEIWELRPGKNRVLYFFYKNNKYILLHHFVKKTQKTPRREIKKPKKEMKDYIEREGKNENLENI